MDCGEEITDLEDVQNLQLGIIDKMDSFCLENNIRYFLAYGTLIGAIRHEGFIPWDDDIDVWMLRPDYDRFLEVFPAWAEKNGLFLNSPSTARRYNRVFSKVCDSRTILVETDRRNEFEEGAFVDVFPVDGLPATRGGVFMRLTELQRHKAKLLCATKMSPHKNGESLRKKLVISLATVLFRRVNVEREVSLYEKAARKSSICPDGYVTFAMPSGKMGRNGVAKAECFARSALVSFSGRALPVPAGYDELLRGIYGDYMQLPPEECRVPHHSFKLYWKRER